MANLAELLSASQSEEVEACCTEKEEAWEMAAMEKKANARVIWDAAGEQLAFAIEMVACLEKDKQILLENLVHQVVVSVSYALRKLQCFSYLWSFCRTG